MKNKQKIIIGISGGVDSSVTALLLQKKGYEVEGVFLDFWKNTKSKDGFMSAQKVAKFLDIPLHKVDARKKFKKIIVDEFIKEYEKGNTPNPCVLCNPTMKFKILMEEMNKRRADFMATGHYAKITAIKQNLNYKQKVKKNKKYKLFRAKDKTKDQSYFLYGLSQDQLSKIIFPLGNYLKSEVRDMAKEAGLSTAKREESQDVCFITQKNFSDFLKKYIKNKKGKIVDENNNVLGEHYGLHFYTNGQRKGIDLGGNGPYYVIRKDLKKNNLIVSNDKNKLYSKEFLIKETNWLVPDLKFPVSAMTKIRYHSDFVRAIIILDKNKKMYQIKLDNSQRAITSGQSAVFYLRDEVLGGGIITRRSDD